MDSFLETLLDHVGSEEWHITDEEKKKIIDHYYRGDQEDDHDAVWFEVPDGLEDYARSAKSQRDVFLCKHPDFQTPMPCGIHKRRETDDGLEVWLWAIPSDLIDLESGGYSMDYSRLKGGTQV